MTEQCRLDIRKYLFSQKTIKEWNKLSTNCVNTSSMNMYKTKLKNISGGELHIDENIVDSINFLVHLPSGVLVLDGNLVKVKVLGCTSVCPMVLPPSTSFLQPAPAAMEVIRGQPLRFYVTKSLFTFVVVCGEQDDVLEIARFAPVSHGKL